MIDTIVQEVRAIRAAIAEEFGYDRARYLAWARKQPRRQYPEMPPAPSESGKNTFMKGFSSSTEN